MPGRLAVLLCAPAIILALSTWPAAGLDAGDAVVDLVPSRSCGEMSARVIKRVCVPRSYHEGLYYDGKNIWLCNGEGGKIWVVDPATERILSEMAPVGSFTEAITAKGDGTYFTTEWYDKNVYNVSIDSDRLEARSCVSVAPSHPAGAVWAGDRLYVVTWDRGLTGTKFAILEMDGEMNIIRKVRVRTVQEPCQLAWDGEHLWMTSWYDRRVYKIDVRSWEIVGYLCSPVEKTTGVMWDGKYLWVTGTYADIYQMSVSGQQAGEGA